MGIGSLLGAVLMLPYARAKASPNALTILAGVILVAVLVLMTIVPNLWMFLPVTALAGVSWTVSASELWIAGQRAMPYWARGRMNAVHRMTSQGGMAVWSHLGRGSEVFGPRSDAGGRRFSFDGQSCVSYPAFDTPPALQSISGIHFAHGLNLDPSPLKTAHEFPLAPRAEDGRYGHMGDDHSSGRPGKVLALTKEVR